MLLQKLNQDVCELSTALSKTELLLKAKDEEALEALKTWEQTGETPATEFLGRLLAMEKEVGFFVSKVAAKTLHDSLF